MAALVDQGSHFVYGCRSLFVFGTLQQKNTCAHNSTHKAHANGIKKAKRTKYVSTRGMDPKFLRNQKFAKKYNGSKRVHDE
jgi:large subunit ribosomal protein L29e